MARQSVAFEWQITDDERWWNHLPTVAADAAVGMANQSQIGVDGEQRLLWHLARGLILFCLGLLVVTSSALTPADRERIRLQTAIYKALALEEQAWRTNNATLYDSLVDEQASGQWRSEWRSVWSIAPQDRQTLGTKIMQIAPDGDLAQVQVLITSDAPEWWRSSPYRETRFYRQTTTGWVRTMPPAHYWGKVQTLETTHLHFEFYGADSQDVAAIAPQMEAGYLRLYQLLALPIPASQSKLKFGIVPETASGWMAEGDAYEIASPRVSKVPGTLSDAAFLGQNIMSHLVYRVLNSGQDGRSVTAVYRWRTMQWALNGWLRATVLDQRAPWHQQAEAHFRSYLQEHWPLRLAGIAELSSNEPRDRIHLMGQYKVAESVIDYVVDTYGRERLPIFLRSFRRYNSWDQLIHEVWNESTADFESGWNRYLVRKYGVVRPGSVIGNLD
jgi:hypothetical protein